MSASARYDLERFKNIAKVLSSAEKKSVDDSLESIHKTQEEISKLSGLESAIDVENKTRLGQIKRLEENNEKLMDALTVTLWKLKDLATVAEDKETIPQSRAEKIIKYCRDAVSGIRNWMTVTGDKSLNREIAKIEQELERLIKGKHDVPTNSLKEVSYKILGLLPRALRAVIVFMQDLAVTLKASYHQVEGYDNLVSKVSKKIWGNSNAPKTPSAPIAPAMPSPEQIEANKKKPYNVLRKEAKDDVLTQLTYIRRVMFVSDLSRDEAKFLYLPLGKVKEAIKNNPGLDKILQESEVYREVLENFPNWEDKRGIVQKRLLGEKFPWYAAPELPPEQIEDELKNDAENREKKSPAEMREQTRQALLNKRAFLAEFKAKHEKPETELKNAEEMSKKEPKKQTYKEMMAEARGEKIDKKQTGSRPNKKN
jgi:hypothetical protein